MIEALHQNYQAIKRVADQHQQLREYSCVQSAVEMALKLYGVIGEEAYPEQCFLRLDKEGFAPYHQLGRKTYHGVTVTFREEKFDTNLCKDWRSEAWDRGVALLAQGIYPIYSFVVPNGDYHAYVGIPNDAESLQFTTKKTLGPSEADIQSIHSIWRAQKKTEILVVRIDYPT